MKILCDFDGVLTDITHEASRAQNVFVDELMASNALPDNDVKRLLSLAQHEMQEQPFSHGWRVNGRISAFWQEDGFIANNALAACLDDWANNDHDKQNRGQHQSASLLRHALKKPTFNTFTDVAEYAFRQALKETASGSHNPIDPEVVSAFEKLLCKGVRLVIVSNSDTHRIESLLRLNGLSPVRHDDDPTAYFRIRGNARKSALGDSANMVSFGPCMIDVSRPYYETILVEEAPDVVVGDVFSLDLALPLSLKMRQVLLRRRSYTPRWALDMTKDRFSSEVNLECFDTINELTALA